MRRVQWFSALLIVLDLALLLSALWLAFVSWQLWRPDWPHAADIQFLDLLPFNRFMPSGVVLGVGWVFVLRQLGYYSPTIANTAVRAAGILSRSLIYILVLAVSLKALSPDRYYEPSFPRSLTAFFLLYGFAVLGITRWLFMRFRGRLPVPMPVHRVAILGVSADAALMAERIERFGQGAFVLEGFLRPRASDGAAPEVPEEQILGGMDELAEIVTEHPVDTVILSSRGLEREDALELTTRCAQMGLHVMQVPFTWGIVSPRLSFAQMGELQLIDLSTLSYPSVGNLFKRVFDLLVGSLLLLLLLPLMAVIALWIRMVDKGPVFYSSKRIGRNGRVFSFLKFRSMEPGAEEKRAEMAEQNESDGRLFKMQDDPRVTPIGRRLRRWSLDELPQIWNVLRGDMNLVGPRPLPEGDLDGIENDPEIAYWFEMRHKVPPGITGLWQVSGRSDLGFREMVQLDIFYIQNWSPWLDLKILIATIPAVLRGRGAA
jgi:exopolysaccharide biosynthesis polyprenyl glycosylphosphotransferase